MQKALRLAIFLTCLATSTSWAGEKCDDTVAATWDPSGRTMTLTKDYRYVDPLDIEWRAAKGRSVDGASIPQFLWSLIGGPYEGRYRNASVVHDVACRDEVQPWRAVHRMFFNHMICSGVKASKAKVMYWAVFQCGPRWGDDQGLKPFPCTDFSAMRTFLAAVANMVETQFTSANVAHDITLEELEKLTIDDLTKSSQLADFDLREPVPDLALPLQQQIEMQRQEYARIEAELQRAQAEIARRSEAERIRAMQEELARMAEMRSSETGFIVTLPGIFFDTGKTTLKPGARNTLARIAEQLRTARDLEIQIEGHTDSVGSDEANLAISERRAAAVRDFLVSQGVDGRNITAVGRGETEPLATNNTPAGRQQNRRVELIIGTVKAP